MKRTLLQQLILYEYRYIIGYLTIFGLTAYAMFWRLGTLVPGLSSLEIEQASLSTDLGTLVDNPLDPLFRILQWLSFAIAPDPLVATRLPGAILGIASVALMYKVVTLKFSARIGIVTTILFAMSSWLLSYARFGHPAITTVFLLIALIYVTYKAYETRSLVWLSIAALVGGIGLYHRWFIYFLLIGGVVSLPVIREQVHLIKNRNRYIFIGIGVVLLAPLMVALVQDPALIRTMLNLPDSVPGFGEILQNAQDSLAHVFWAAKDFPTLYLGTVPMLDIFSAAMVALGLYHLDHEISKTLSRFVLASFGFGFVMLSINPDPFAFAVLLPFTYVLLAAGFVMLIGQWNEIFPKNPIARMVAFVPLAVLVISVLSYHNERYFLAWPRTPEVLQQYPESIGRLNGFINTTTDNVVVIGVSAETETYEIVTRTYDSVQFITTDTEVAILSAQTAIVTPEAEEQLPQPIRDQLPPVRRLLSSSSSFESTLFVIYSQD